MFSKSEGCKYIMHMMYVENPNRKEILTKRARSCIFGFLLPRRFLSVFKASFACLQFPIRFKHANKYQSILTNKNRKLILGPRMNIKKYTGKFKQLYPGSILIISHNSMFIAQSGPISISLVALSAQAAALLAMSTALSVKSLVLEFEIS